MKLLVFTPVAKKSAIARSTKLVVDELGKQGHEVRVVASDLENNLTTENFEYGFKIVHWTEISLIDDLLKTHAVVYQVGDNFQFHAGSAEWLTKQPGVVVLHDAYLGSLFSAWSAKDPVARFEMLSMQGDSEDERDVFSKHQSNISFMDEAHKSTKFILKKATSVITHSQWSANYCLKIVDVPVLALPLPWESDGSSEGALTLTGKTFTVLTIGHVNPNKRASSVITAIGELGLPQSEVEYKLAGEITPALRVKLTGQAVRMNVNLKILGRLSDEQLEAEIMGASVISNLRHPTLEGASASLLDAFSRGKAVIVSDEGHYADLPDDVVIKIPPRSEIPSLTQVLRKLLNSKGFAVKMGDAGLRYFKEKHVTEKYASALSQVIDSATKYIPLVVQRNRSAQARTLYFRELHSMGFDFEMPRLKARIRGLNLRQVSFELRAKIIVPSIHHLARQPKLVAFVKFAYRKYPATETLINKVVRLLAG